MNRDRRKSSATAHGEDVRGDAFLEALIGSQQRRDEVSLTLNHLNVSTNDLAAFRDVTKTSQKQKKGTT